MLTNEQMTDEQLLESWRAGDDRAGQVLFNRHYKPVARFFAHKLGPDTDDIVQETFFGLLRARERFEGRSSFRTFLFAIARNQLLLAIRRSKRERERFDPSANSIAALDPSPSTLLGVRDQQRLLLTALRRLPLDVQLMLELHHWEKLKIKEIAEVLDINENTVKARMARGRKQLDESMQELAESKQQLQNTFESLSEWAARLRVEVGDGP